jgi:hypothetical protein
VNKPTAIACAVAMLALAGCPRTGALRPNRALAADVQGVCEGDFDQAPRLSSGKSPYFPISMLSASVVEDRKTRHLPLTWSVTTTFTVAADGRTAAIRATPTQPQSFSDHVVVAVRSWRFQPARKDGVALASQCTNEFGFVLQ